jgi:hypothetical protein
MNLQFGDVVLVPLPFQEAVGEKVRPVVVVFDTGDSDFVVAPVTSTNRHSDFDLFLQDWQTAGLNVASTVKLAVVYKHKIVRLVGRLSDADASRLSALLCGAYCRDH